MSSPSMPQVISIDNKEHWLMEDKPVKIPKYVHENIPELINKCLESKNNSYSPYSKFRVGASLLTHDGKIYGGCNVENASYGLSICAEKCAFVKAVSDGYREFGAIAVSTDIKDYFGTPCGSCRQFIVEFGDCLVIMVCPDKSYKICNIYDLLPFSFSSDDLEKPRTHT